MALRLRDHWKRSQKHNLLTANAIFLDFWRTSFASLTDTHYHWKNQREKSFATVIKQKENKFLFLGFRHFLVSREFFLHFYTTLFKTLHNKPPSIWSWNVYTPYPFKIIKSICIPGNHFSAEPVCNIVAIVCSIRL